MGVSIVHLEVPDTFRCFRLLLSRAIVLPCREATTEKKSIKYFSLVQLPGNFPNLFTLVVMVNSAHVEAVAQPQDEVDLTDDQIQQLLLEAEGRLRGPTTLTSQDDTAALR